MRDGRMLYLTGGIEVPMSHSRGCSWQRLLEVEELKSEAKDRDMD